MLTIEALQSALPLAERLDQRGFVALPRPDTPLEMLCARTRSGEEVVSATDGVTIKVDVQQMALSAAAKDPVFGESQHDQALDDIAGVCIPAVQGHIKHAREVVAPAVDELVTRTTELLSHQTTAKLLGMEVTVEEVPAPLTNSSFDTMVRKYEETPLNSPALTFDLPDQTGAEIVELMKTGSGSLDSEIEQFASTLGDGCLMGIWRDLFQQSQADIVDTRAKRFIDYLQDSECGLDNALVIFLLARKLVDNPLDGITMSLQSYETLMADFRDQAAAHLCRELDAIDQAERNGALVVKFTNNNIVVNDALYRKWLEDGGDNDVLFGNLLQSNPYVMLADIEENAQQLKRAWANHSALVGTVEQNKRFARTKEALASVFRTQMRDMADDERANIDVEKAINRFDVLLDDVVESELDCLYTIALRLVCRSRFIRTEAERILGGIDRIKKKNPELDIREAAEISVIEYVAWWVATQVYVVDAKTMKMKEQQSAPVVVAG
jgi:hypothetical protein